MHVGILGGGAFGRALAATCRRAGNMVEVWTRKEGSLEAVVRAADGLILAVPAQAVRTLLEALATLPDLPPVLLTAKGLEASTGFLMGEVMEEVCPRTPWAFLSGPHRAVEVEEGKPTVGLLAGQQRDVLERMKGLLAHEGFRLQVHDDVLGAQVSAAWKNVVGIRCGKIFGQGLGYNALACALWEGFEEAVRWGVSLGAQRETFYHPVLLADWVLSTQHPITRNFAYGVFLGKGGRPEDYEGPLAEGVLCEVGMRRRSTLDKGVAFLDIKKP